MVSLGRAKSYMAAANMTDPQPTATTPKAACGIASNTANPMSRHAPAPAMEPNRLALGPHGQNHLLQGTYTKCLGNKIAMSRMMLPIAMNIPPAACSVICEPNA